MFPFRLGRELSLELLDVRHAEELFHLTDANREHLRAWLPWVDPARSTDDTRAFIRLTRKRLAERLRFTPEGTVRQAEWLYDHFVDLVVYGMLASDWTPSRTDGTP